MIKSYGSCSLSSYKTIDEVFIVPVKRKLWQNKVMKASPKSLIVPLVGHYVGQKSAQPWMMITLKMSPPEVPFLDPLYEALISPKLSNKDNGSGDNSYLRTSSKLILPMLGNHITWE